MSTCINCGREACLTLPEALRALRASTTEKRLDCERAKSARLERERDAARAEAEQVRRERDEMARRLTEERRHADELVKALDLSHYAECPTVRENGTCGGCWRSDLLAAHARRREGTGA